MWNSAWNNTHSLTRSMKALPLVALLTASLFLAPTAVAQLPDTGSMLGIQLAASQPKYYVDDEGYTVVIGEVNNLKDFPVTDVRVLVNFYTKESGESPHESQIGDTILKVIPPFGSSPYEIRSKSQGLDVTGVAPSLLGFTSSVTKETYLDVGEPTVSAIGTVSINGSVTNNAGDDAINPIVYALVYDALVPPRVIAIHSIPITTMSSGITLDYEFAAPDNEQASFVRIIVESDNYASNVVDVPIMRYLTQPLVIRDIITVNSDGDFVFTLYKDIPVYIRSTVTGQDIAGLEYMYIVQVKRSDTPSVVEFIGTFEGSLLSSGLAQPLVEWIPENSGLFFVQTYVWNLNDTPLSSPGPVTLLHVR